MRWRDFSSLSPLPDTFFDAPRRVHFIGIGGIGMSALAFALKSRGHFVSGSDASESAMLQKLRDAGVQIVLGHDESNLRVLAGGAEAVIFGSAISENNAERVAANNADIPQWHRAQLLAYFVNNAKVSIAVSGTHGKSTTSAMIAHILTKCGKNPTAILGAIYPPFDSNVRLGDPDLVVVEADESDGSFTLLHPTIAVVTNVEAEHLENYEGSEDELWRAFEMFANQTKDNVILNADDTLLMQKLDKNLGPTFGLNNRKATILGDDIRVENRATIVDVDWGDTGLGDFRLGAPGRHNVSNALAALCAADAFTGDFCRAAFADGENKEFLSNVLADFHGVKRRFQFIGEANDVLVYDDYGHHPTEVASTLETAREFLSRPIIAVFQPHRFSRTQQMGHLFGPSFAAADRVIITQLYSAFEEPIAGVSGKIVFDSVQQAFPDKPLWYAETLEEARRIARDIARPGDAMMCMGAGDITTLPPQLLEDLK
jgi:UDP-N-acetylmuramate--alanine ligase